MATKNSFISYHDWIPQTAFLTDKQFGELMRGVFAYSMSGTEPSFSEPVVFACFQCIKVTMDKDRAKWEQTCANRRAAGAKGGRPRKNQPEPEHYQVEPEPELKTQPTNEVLFSEKNQTVLVEAEYEHEHEHEHEYEPDCELASKLASASAAAEKKEPDELSQLLVKETGITPTAKQQETMKGWCKKYGKDAVKNLISEAKDNNAHTFAYLVAIVRRWERDGGPSKPRRRKCQGPQPCAAPTGATQAELDANRRQLEKLLEETAWMDEGVSA